MSDGLKMFARWETDDNAFLLEPYIANTTNIQRDAPDMSLHQWLTNMKLYHFSKLRSKSHMVMSIGDKPAMFLDIPDNLNDEFLSRYADAIDSGEHLYLMEYSTRFEYFNFFVDFDYVDRQELSQSKILEYVLTIQQIVKKYIKDNDSNADVYVSACIDKCSNGFKSGLHLKFPNFMVNSQTALEIIAKCEEEFYMLDDTIDWDLVFDKCVYGDDCGIRMIYSRKTTNSIDVGRVHKMLFAFDSGTNQINIQNKNTLEIVKLMSIYKK
jgi:hypothetical protein